jgi:hypothetical protein
MEDISHFVKIDSNWGASYICRTPINFFFPLFGLVFGMDPASIYIYIYTYIYAVIFAAHLLLKNGWSRFNEWHCEIQWLLNFVTSVLECLCGM